MYIHGEFINKRGERVAVMILTNGDRSEEMEIGTEESGLWFTAESPVVVENEVDDTFDVLLRRSAKITLLCRNYVPEFFCTSARSAVVNVLKDGRCVFAGFLEPQTYSQPYNEVLDELELNCLDALSGLQYMNYKAVGSLGVVYEIVRSETSQRTFGELVLEVLRSVSEGLDLTKDDGVETPSHEDSGEEDGGVETAAHEDSGEENGGVEADAETGSLHVWFDGSKGTSKEGCKGTQVFDELAVNDLLFMGSSADEVWQQSEVLEEVLKYLDLHVVQDGFEFYLFSWETVKGAMDDGVETPSHEDSETTSGTITWYELGGDGTKETERKEVTISLDNVEGMDTEISIGEVYNQLLLTADMEKVENVIENPLDSDALVSAYDGMQKYMTEYFVNVEGLTEKYKMQMGAHQRPVYYYEFENTDEMMNSYQAMDAMVHERSTTYKNAYKSDWYIRVKQHAHWRFPMGDGAPIEGKAPLSADEDLTAYAVRNGVGQNQIMNWLYDEPGRGCIAAFGNIKSCMADSTNNAGRPSMENRMVISVGGGTNDKNSDSYQDYEELAAKLAAARPLAIYEHMNASAVYSPSDDAITNYMVLSGKVVLNRVAEVTSPWWALVKDMGQYSDVGTDPLLYRDVVAKTGRDYTKMDDDGGRPRSDFMYYGQRYWSAANPQDDPVTDTSVVGLHPYTGECGGRLDHFTAPVRLLACMLVIGDKCVVETGVLGTSPSYEWRTYKVREECESDDEYYSQCFYITIQGDSTKHLVGDEYEFRNNITVSMGIDAEGIAIPMRKGDKLSGAVRFMIVGPKFMSYSFGAWTEIVLTSVVGWTRSIELKDFEVKVYSDSGHYDGGSDDKDVVYMSDTKEKFVNRKEDIEFKINSALTAAECRSLGVANSVNMSTPVNTATGEGVLTIYDKSRDEAAKAEQLYVDSYYTEYHKPRILLTQTVRDDADVVGLFNHYRHKALNKEFYVQGVGLDLMEGEATLTLKEVNSD